MFPFRITVQRCRHHVNTILPSISVAKGTGIVVPILAMNRNPDVWGSNAHEFYPERWLDPSTLPDGAQEMPSVHFPTFLAGPRACIGFRITLIE